MLFRSIPFEWKKDFSEKYLPEIKYYCLVMTAEYIENNFSDICKYENAIENRLPNSGVKKQDLLEDNENNLRLCKRHGLNYILIDKTYEIKIDLQR